MDSRKTVFQQVWDGTLPSFPIFCSQKHGIQVVLDIFPAQPGHMLIIPKEPVDHIFELEPYRYLQLFTVAQAAAKQIMDIQKPLRVMHIVSGYDIPHVHLHLLPSFKRGDTEANLLAGREGIRADDKDLFAMQKKLEFSSKLSRIVEARLEHIAEHQDSLARGESLESLMSRL
jgi:histidine triad (HIT) family protein